MFAQSGGVMRVEMSFIGLAGFVGHLFYWHFEIIALANKHGSTGSKSDLILLRDYKILFAVK
jgi:hypothetical protein